MDDVTAGLPSGVALLERSQTLAPDATSAGEARRLVRGALEDLDRDDWADLAELAVSEVVTNASLHAHTDIEVHVGVYDDEVYVQVRDFNPSLPAARNYDEEATTGRGMGLVAAVARSCGVVSLGEEGKVVWFCVGDGGPDPDAVPGAWIIDDVAESLDPEGPVVELLSMPATLWMSARQHHDAILRELVLYLAEHDEMEADVASADLARGRISNALVVALEDAQASGAAGAALPVGHPSLLPWVPADLDLRVPLPADASAAFAALQDVLDLAEALAVEGQLFTRPGLPEIVAARDWACEQIISQLAGSPPSPWPGTAQTRFETAVHDRVAPDEPAWDRAAVAEATTGAIAADDANRIIAVSAPLAKLLGWDVDELVGRRVVAVIPPSLREAHVAGFSRHLSTGEAHVLGVPLDLPVLCKDGAVVQCQFLIEQAASRGGRPVYVAWIDPID